MTNATLSGNQAGEGGGGLFNESFAGSPANAALTATTVSNNTITSAGTTNGVDISGPAIYQAAGALTITNSTISGNLGVLGGTTNGVSGQSDAAISVSGGNVTVRNTTISGNTAATGANILSSGALDLLDPAGTTSVTNSTLNDNRGGTLNGGIYTQGTLTLASTTIARNHADTFGGLYVFGGSTTLTDTLIADNTGSRTDGYGNISSASANNLIGDGGGFSGIINGSNSNQIGTTGNPINPRLDPNGLQPNGSIGPKTIALSPNSPAIEADGACPNGVRADERGQPRVGNCDIGAYEYQPVLPTVMNATGPVTGGPVTFHGIGFQTGSRLTLGSPFSATRDAPASAVSADGTSMTLDLPAGAAAGPVAGGMTITNPGLPPSARATFTYLPVITGLSPSSGVTTGGGSVTIAGTGFAAGVTSVTFDGRATTVQVNNGTQLTVTVTVSGASATKVAAYTYGTMNPAPQARPPSGSSVTGNPGAAPSPRLSSGVQTGPTPNPVLHAR